MTNGEGARDEKADEFKNRMSSRFDSTEKDASDHTSETHDASEPSESSEKPEASEKAETSDRSENVRKPENVKKEWSDGAMYVYLPPDELPERIDQEYERLRYECKRDGGVSIQKDRHYKPIVVIDGLEAVEEMSGETFLTRAEELGFR